MLFDPVHRGSSPVVVPRFVIQEMRQMRPQDYLLFRRFLFEFLMWLKHAMRHPLPMQPRVHVLRRTYNIKNARLALEFTLLLQEVPEDTAAWATLVERLKNEVREEIQKAYRGMDSTISLKIPKDPKKKCCVKGR
jgi:hypothetical protein